MSFRQKPEKVKYLTATKSIDELHRNKVSEFERRKADLPRNQESLRQYKKQLHALSVAGSFTPENIKVRSMLIEKIEKLEKEIFDVKNCVSELDYYVSTGDILTEYYDFFIDDPNDCVSDNEEDTSSNSIGTESVSTKLIEINKQSQQTRKLKKPTKKRIRKSDQPQGRSILSFFTNMTTKPESITGIPDASADVATTSDTTTEVGSTITKKISNKGTLLNEYLTITDRTYIAPDKAKSQMPHKCSDCGVSRTLIRSDGIYVCQNCGKFEQVIIESEIPNHKEAANEKPRYPYKRLNHLQEWLNQFQAKESTEIPDDTFILIVKELKRQRISIKSLPYEEQWMHIRKTLKKLRLNRYYEHISHIISKITKIPPPVLTREVEDKIKAMFKKAQEPFVKYCPNSRINFLNYSYILNKFFRILGMEEYSKCFQLLKSKEKLRAQDRIWRKICTELDWEYHPSI